MWRSLVIHSLVNISIWVAPYSSSFSFCCGSGLGTFTYLHGLHGCGTRQIMEYSPLVCLVAVSKWCSFAISHFISYSCSRWNIFYDTGMTFCCIPTHTQISNVVGNWQHLISRLAYSCHYDVHFVAIPNFIGVTFSLHILHNRKPLKDSILWLLQFVRMFRCWHRRSLRPPVEDCLHISAVEMEAVTKTTWGSFPPVTPFSFTIHGIRWRCLPSCFLDIEQGFSDETDLGFGLLVRLWIRDWVCSGQQTR